MKWVKALVLPLSPIPWNPSESAVRNAVRSVDIHHLKTAEQAGRYTTWGTHQPTHAAGAPYVCKVVALAAAVIHVAKRALLHPNVKSACGTAKIVTVIRKEGP